MTFFKPFKTSILSLGLISSIMMGFTEVASAKSIQLLVQTGQILPQNSEPIEQFFEPTIGRDRQVAVIVQHREKVTPLTFPAGSFDRFRFVGLNVVSPTNQIQLVDSTEFGFGGFSSFTGSFSAPSISEGKIAYTFQRRSTTRGVGFAPDIEFKVGTAAGSNTVINFGRVDRTYGVSQPTVAFVNGRAFLLDFGPFFTGNPVRPSTLERIDTRSTPPNQTVLITDATNRAIRASADNLLLSQLSTSSGTNVYRLFEKPIDSGNFKELFPLGQNPASCGFAASYKNVAVCSSSPQGTILSVRLGQTSPFVAIPLPSGVTQVANPSMSNASVLFQAKAPKAGSSVDTIYLSTNGKAPTIVIQSGEKLNNKTITSLKLSTNGRAIADQSAVFLAGFSDGSTGLFRVDF